MVVLTLLFLIIDICSKLVIIKQLEVNQSIILINNFLAITYAKNTGVAWSLFNDRVFLISGVSFLVIIGILWYVIKNKPNNFYEKIAFALILGGAIGNWLNRIFYGYVIDFIDIRIFNYNYPVFNFADMFIVIGVILLILFDWWCNNARNKGRK